MKNFLTKGDLQLVKGGYLVNKEETPVYNEDFVKLQKHAEYVVTFAKVAKGKDLVGKKATSLQDIQKEVKELLTAKAPVFVENTTTLERPLTEKLKEEALNFMNFQENSGKIEKINAFLQQFEKLAEFENFGLFFTEDVVKLNAIYTMEEVVAAVTETIDLLK